MVGSITQLLAPQRIDDRDTGISMAYNPAMEQSTPISVYLDNNVWDFLFERKLDLSAVLPRPEFCICITREAEFEIPPIPPEKTELKAFIDETIAKCDIKVDSLFGFYDESLPPDKQRVGGFDVGRWASADEIAFINQQKTPVGTLKKNRKTGLYKNEADVSLAARSFHSVVLTHDKSGPINEAYRQGGKVVYLTNFDESGMSLGDFIKVALMLRPYRKISG
jgi:hypothetical protein